MNLTFRLILLVCWSPLLLTSASALGQEAKGPKEKYAQEYTHAFSVEAKNRAMFDRTGPDADQFVTYDAKGLRIALPPGERPTIGVVTRFGVKGDFEITVPFEIVKEPTQEQAGSLTKFAVSVTSSQGKNQSGLFWRVNGKEGVQFARWFMLQGQSKGTIRAPAKASSGQLRIVRNGSMLEYWVAEGKEEAFKALDAVEYTAEDVRSVTVTCATGGPNAFIEARVAEIRIRADGVPVSNGPAVAAIEAVPPAREYAKTQTFAMKGNALPEGWDFLGPEAHACVRFEPFGMRLTLPIGWKGDRPSTGIELVGAVKGDFEITSSFEILNIPKQEDAGPISTRISIAIFKDTGRANVATVSRSMSATNGNVFVSWQSLWNEEAEKQATRVNFIPTLSKLGRLRLVRDGADLYFLSSVGLDGEFRTIKKYAFGPEDLKQVRLMGATGGEKASLDARFFDVRIRSGGVAGAADVLIDPGSLKSPADGQRSWLTLAALSGGLILILLLALFLIVYLYLRRRAASTPVADAAADAPELVVLECAECGKKLKTKAASAGKKLRCPQCSAAVVVP